MTNMVARGAMLAIGVAAMTSPLFASGKKPVDPDKRICRAEAATGSLFRIRSCHTAAEWARIDDAVARNATLFNDHRNRPGDVGAVESAQPISLGR